MSLNLEVESEYALPLVHMSVQLRTGAASEDPAGQEGLLRVLARLLRRTGDGLRPEELDARIDTLGGSLFVDVSHSVWGVQATVLERSLDALVGLLEGVLVRPSLAEEELARLLRESDSELTELLDDDRSLCRRWFARTLYAGHPYGRPTGGTRKSLTGLTRESVAALHRLLLTRENVTFGFAGAISEERARALAERLQAALPVGPERVERCEEPPAPVGRHLTFVDKPERSQTQILIGALGSHPADPDHTALHVGNTVFGGTFTARLTQEVRAKRGWSYGAYSSLPLDRRRRSFSMWTFPKAEDAAACIELELELLERWVADGITDVELERAKAYLVRSFAFSEDSAGKRLGQRLDERVFGLPRGYYAEYRERVAAVTRQEVEDAVRARIDPTQLVISVVGTEAEIGEAVRQACGSLSSSRVVPYTCDDLEPLSIQD